MSVDASLAARLRRLDARAAAALVADLWAARGFATDREGDRVVASADGESVLVRVVGGGVGTGASADRAAEVLVALGGRDAAVAGDDTRVLDAVDLAEMLLYAVDRETADDLCRRHLGDELGDLSARNDGIRERMRAVGATLPAAPGEWSPGVPASRAALALVGLVVVVGVAGAAGLTLGPGATGQSGDRPAGAVAETPVAVPTGTAAPATSPSRTATPAAGVASIPGLSSGGVANLTALAAAHERVLSGQAYTVWLDLYRPRGGVPNATRIQRDVDVAVAGERSLVEATVEDGRTRMAVLTVYDDGTDRYVAESGRFETNYDRLAADERPPMAVPGPDALDRGVVARYLATPRTAVVGRVEAEGWMLYRVAGRGRPADPAFDDVGNYTVTALVDRRGFVRALTAEYVVDTDSGSYPVRFELLYDRLGRTTVSPPGWYERRFERNGTGTGAATAAG